MVGPEITVYRWSRLELCVSMCVGSVTIIFLKSHKFERARGVYMGRGKGGDDAIIISKNKNCYKNVMSEFHL